MCDKIITPLVSDFIKFIIQDSIDSLETTTSETFTTIKDLSIYI